MSKLVQDRLDRGEARIVAAPGEGMVDARRCQVDSDRNFELPTALYAATVGLYLAFIGVMFAGLGNPMLAIPMVIFAVFIVAGFGVPAIWVRLRDNVSKPLDNGQFGRSGIMTCTGRLTARDASIQMLILPVLIVLWGIAAITIAAMVS